MDSNAPTWPGSRPSPSTPDQQQQSPAPYAPQPALPRPRRPWLASRVAQAIDLLLGIVEALLALRLVLLLLAANPTAGFSSWVYNVTVPLVAPFQGVFPNVLGAHGNFLDTAEILAMIVYALAAWGLQSLVRVLLR